MKHLNYRTTIINLINQRPTFSTNLGVCAILPITHTTKISLKYDISIVTKGNIHLYKGANYTCSGFNWRQSY